MIITLSDRAAAGVYNDRSGPRVRELLDEFFAKRRWHYDAQERVLPDDPEQLRREILAAGGRDSDVIITTGGTGVGPRDSTPETIAPLCDKLIPGIMEHLRAKFGGQIPAPAQPGGGGRHGDHADLCSAGSVAPLRSTCPKSSPRLNTWCICCMGWTCIDHRAVGTGPFFGQLT